MLLQHVGTSVVNFPSGAADTIADADQRALDRDLILERVAAAMKRDFGTIRDVYAHNAEESLSGTHSARQEDIDDENGSGSVRLLGVAQPVLQPDAGPPPWPRGVDYVDGLGPGVVPGGHEAFDQRQLFLQPRRQLFLQLTG